MVGRPWISVLTFMILNLISVVFQCSVKPYAKALDNYLNIFNGLLSLVVAYLIVQLSDLKYDPETKEKIGEYIVNAIYLAWGINFCVNVSIILLELKNKIRKFYLKKLRWKYAFLRPKITLQKKSEH